MVSKNARVHGARLHRSTVARPNCSGNRAGWPRRTRDDRPFRRGVMARDASRARDAVAPYQVNAGSDRSDATMTVNRTTVTMIACGPDRATYGVFQARVRNPTARWTWNIHRAR